MRQVTPQTTPQRTPLHTLPLQSLFSPGNRVWRRAFALGLLVLLLVRLVPAVASDLLRLDAGDRLADALGTTAGWLVIGVMIALGRLDDHLRV